MVPVIYEHFTEYTKLTGEYVPVKRENELKLVLQLKKINMSIYYIMRTHLVCVWWGVCACACARMRVRACACVHACVRSRVRVRVRVRLLAFARARAFVCVYPAYHVVFCCVLVFVGALIILLFTSCKSFLGCNDPSAVYNRVSILKFSLCPIFLNE